MLTKGGGKHITSYIFIYIGKNMAVFLFLVQMSKEVPVAIKPTDIIIPFH